MLFFSFTPTPKIKNVSDDFSIYTRLTETAMYHPNSDLRSYESLEVWAFVGLSDLEVDIPKTVFYTPRFRKAPSPKPAYMLYEKTYTKENEQGEEEQTDEYTYYRDYAGSFEVRGVIRISQSLNLEYKAPIDIMMFFDIPTAKHMETTNILLKSPYKGDIYNYQLVKDILGKERFDKFMTKRFNYEIVGFEGEIYDIDGTYSTKTAIYCLLADYYLYDIDYAYRPNEGELSMMGFPIANVRNFKMLDSLPKIADIADIIQSDVKELALRYGKNNITPTPVQYNLKIPMINGVFAQTKTDEGIFFVDVRDKPSKRGKIVAQLYSQSFKIKNKNIIYDVYGIAGEPDFFIKWYEAQQIAQKAFFTKNKDSLINPFYRSWDLGNIERNRDNYIVFVWDILEGNWAKVWILRYAIYMVDLDSKEKYIDTFLNYPSKIKLYDGYIHTSGLEPLCVFPRE